MDASDPQLMHQLRSYKTFISSKQKGIKTSSTYTVGEVDFWIFNFFLKKYFWGFF
jgi:hypothetical protein